MSQNSYFLNPLKQIDHRLSQINTAIGKAVAWLTIAMMLLTCIIVVLRYGFNLGSIALQESITYLHASVFLLAAAFTLRQDGHVRVDIFYQKYSVRKKAWINILGTVVLLLPVAIFILLSSLNYVSNAWFIDGQWHLEASNQPGGLPTVFLLKTLIWCFAISLILQGIADICRNTVLLIETHPQGQA